MFQFDVCLKFELVLLNAPNSNKSKRLKIWNIRKNFNKT